MGNKSSNYTNVKEEDYENRRSCDLGARPISSNPDSFPDAVRKALSYSLADDISLKYDNCSVVFMDIAGFTEWCSESTPEKILDCLSSFFQELDVLAKENNMFKLETVGDSYVCVSGVPEIDENHACRAIEFAKGVIELKKVLHWIFKSDKLNLRVGIHSGEVIAGVIRSYRPRFQLFGDTMNVASRMESTCINGKIQVSESTYNLLPDYDFVVRDKVFAKGKGYMNTYILHTYVKKRRQSISDNLVNPYNSSLYSIKTHVLLIDDLLSSLIRITAFLQGKGIIVTTASGGKDGLSLMKQGFYNAVFCDINMDDLNGIEVIKAYREYEMKENKTRITVYAFTGIDSEDLNVHELLQSGFDHVISKGVSREIFLSYCKG